MVGWLLPRPPVWSGLGPVPRSPKSPPMKDDPLRTVQPVVVPAQLYTWGTVASGFFALFPAYFAGLITMAITRIPGPSIGLGIVTYLIAFALFMVLIGWRAFSGPGVTTYRIYRDRIESEEGLVNRQRRTVLIGRIIDVHLTEGVLQRTQGAGTVTLVIQPLVSQGQGHLAHQTIRLGNIPQPREVYDLIRSLALDRKVAEEGDLD
jgi:membrane protein YdbS with pleckstrin-like domain